MELHRLSENEQAFVECFSRFVNGQMGSAAKVGNAHRLSTQRLATFYSGRFPSTRLRTVHTGLPVHGSPPSHSV